MKERLRNTIINLATIQFELDHYPDIRMESATKTDQLEKLQKCINILLNVEECLD